MTPDEAYREIQPIMPVLLRKYGRMAGRAIERCDIEQSIYEGMLRLLPKYDPALGSFCGFMHKALQKNALREVMKVHNEKQHLFIARKRTKLRSFATKFVEGGDYNEQDRICTVSAHDPDVLESENLQRALSRLPYRYRIALYYHFSGKTFQEIGAIRGISHSSAFFAVKLGLQRLRRILNGTSMDNRSKQLHAYGCSRGVSRRDAIR